MSIRKTSTGQVPLRRPPSEELRARAEDHKVRAEQAEQKADVHEEAAAVFTGKASRYTEIASGMANRAGELARDAQALRRQAAVEMHKAVGARGMHAMKNAAQGLGQVMHKLADTETMTTRDLAADPTATATAERLQQAAKELETNASRFGNLAKAWGASAAAMADKAAAETGGATAQREIAAVHMAQFGATMAEAKMNEGLEAMGDVVSLVGDGLRGVLDGVADLVKSKLDDVVDEARLGVASKIDDAIGQAEGGLADLFRMGSGLLRRATTFLNEAAKQMTPEQRSDVDGMRQQAEAAVDTAAAAVAPDIPIERGVTGAPGKAVGTFAASDGAGQAERASNLGWQAYQAGDFKTAHRLLVGANDLEPGNASILNRLGAAQRQLGDVDGAKASNAAALAADAGFPPANYNAAVLAAGDGDFAKAREHLDVCLGADRPFFDKLIAGDGDLAGLRAFEATGGGQASPVGLERGVSGAPGKAVGTFAASDGAGQAERASNLGWQAYQAGDFKTAHRLLVGANDLEPGNASILNRLGAAQRQLGDVDGAKASNAAALAADAGFPPANYNAAVLAAGDGDFAKAREHLDVCLGADRPFFDKLIAGDGDLAGLRAFEATGGGQASPVGLERGVSGAPGKAVGTFAASDGAGQAERASNLGWQAYQAGDFKTAHRLLVGANDLEPGDASILNRLGAAQRQLGDVDGAKASNAAALAADAGFPPANYNAAVLAAGDGDFAKAREHLDVCLDADRAFFDELIAKDGDLAGLRSHEAAGAAS